MKSKLESVVNERMKGLREQMVADFELAKSRLSEAERQEPGAAKRLQEIMALIETQRAEERLQSLEKLLQVLEGAIGEVRAAVARLAHANYQKGEADAFKRMADRLDAFGFDLFGSKWVDEAIKDVVKQKYQRKERGNGQG
jgi:hypothetical protein